ARNIAPYRGRTLVENNVAFRNGGGGVSGVGLAAVATAVVVPPVSWYAGRATARAGARQVAAFRAVILVALIDVVLLVTSGRVV
ncbi:hypothetical protein AB0I76_17150, partial [Micromonospora sp. NPDC049799]